jgi:phosphoribosylglycinamide formyltransferase-1
VSGAATSEAKRPVVVLGSACAAANIVTNALRAARIDTVLVLERPVSARRLLARRAKRLGLATAFGQVLFRLLAMPLLEWRARDRVGEITCSYGLDPAPVSGDVWVLSVNDPEAREALRAFNPLIVVLVGTRIVSPESLSCVEAPFVNLHAGITPQYRGVHGGYWALVEGRQDLVGSTVHLVDTGIDTGGVLGQAHFEVTERDSFATYPYLHLAVGVPLLVDVVKAAVAGEELEPQPPLVDSSRLWSHPTLGAYLRNRLVMGVR